MSKQSTTQQRQVWLIFFCLGIIMLNFPFMQIFNRLDTLFGLPLLVFYLLVGWPLSIVVIYLFSASLQDKGLPHRDSNPDRELE
ncbi:MAG: hypothetical protein C0620_07380 [Desulfuromonas sp.]|nr:MAG: hypothetical protein C0620_07380 [Desulfuromonas sp.]